MPAFGQERTLRKPRHEGGIVRPKVLSSEDRSPASQRQVRCNLRYDALAAWESPEHFASVPCPRAALPAIPCLF